MKDIPTGHDDEDETDESQQEETSPKEEKEKENPKKGLTHEGNKTKKYEGKNKAPTDNFVIDEILDHKTDTSRRHSEPFTLCDGSVTKPKMTQDSQQDTYQEVRYNLVAGKINSTSRKY